MQPQIDYGPFSPPATNLVDRLAYWASAQADETAFVFLPEGEENEQRITYRQLDARARAIAAQLSAQQLAGERALLLYPPGLDFIAGLFGCLYAGVIAVPAYPPKRNRNMLRIQAIADDAQAAVALTTDEVAQRAGTFFDEAPHLEQLLWLATNVGQVAAPPRESPSSRRAEKGDDVRTPGGVRRDQLAILQYTSGSTGMPKGVMLTHANLMHNVALISHAFGPNRESVGVSWLPTYHDMGLIGGILNPLFYGRPSVFMPPMAFLARPVRWLESISRWRAMISGGPNFAYQLCVDRIREDECRGLDLSCWQVAYNGAEPVRPQTLARFSEKFEPFGFQPAAHYPCYGLAEATLIVTGSAKGSQPKTLDLDAKALADHRVEATQDDESSQRVISSGRPLLDTQIVVARPNTGEALPAGQVGELWIAGPSVAAGYWNHPQESESAFGGRVADACNGSPATSDSRTLANSVADQTYLRTGDLGFLQDGELFVTGRLKDLIIVNGVNRYPQDIEHTVRAAHDRVQLGAAAAFGIEVAGRERLAIACEVQRRRHDDWNEVIRAIRHRVTEDQDLPPDAVVLVRLGSLPKTSSGKIQRHACRAAFLNGDLRVVAQWRGWTAEERPLNWPAWDDDEALEVSAEIDSRTARLVLEQVRAIARERADELSLDTNIVDLGLDSLERVEIVAALEETFGGRLPGDVMAEAETCREVILAVQTYLGDSGSDSEEASTTCGSLKWGIEGSFADMAEVQQLEARTAQLAELGIDNPFFQAHETSGGPTTVLDGVEVINFAGYNYLGMSGDAVVAQAAKDAIDRYGTSVSASRLVSGERPIHGQLERAIADLIGAEDAVVFIGGHATNESTIGHLLGPGDLVLHDALAHNSIIQGALLSGARRRAFPHNDWQALDRLLARIRGDYRRVLIAIEGVYGMDGDIPDVPKLIEVKHRHQALLMIDEAHSLGTLGETGGGIREHFQIATGEVDLWMGTLSKSLGSCGGYIAGEKRIVDYLRYTAPGFVYSVGISPPNAAAALAAIEQMGRHPERVTKMQSLASLFLKLAQRHGLNTGRSKGSPVIPVILGDSALTMRVAQAMLKAGVNVRPLLPPAVEENAARLRFFVTSNHTQQHIQTAVSALTECMRKISAKAAS